MNNERRLERLDKALEVMSLPPRLLPLIFDMDFYGEEHPTDDETGLPDLSCGSAGCFAGEISMHPWFRQRGLVGHWDEHGSLQLAGKSEFGNWNDGITSFFGIDLMEATALTNAFAGRLDSTYLNRKFRLADEAIEGGNTDIVYPPVTQANVRARLRRLIAKYSA